MNVFGLFSGIGGFELGFERAGFRVVGMCELEPYCRAVLRKHWPEVFCFHDVRTVTKDALDLLGIEPDIITGGFPCQDISLAGKGAGLNGERSGLWFEFHRVIEEVRPRFAVIENVSALRSRGLDQVLGSLAEIGYDAEWHCIPASAVGAPHRRDRVWIVAYASANGLQGRFDKDRVRESAGIFFTEIQACDWGEWDGLSKPRVLRVAHGVPHWVDILKALGNAVVPQIPEIIAQAIKEALHGVSKMQRSHDGAADGGLSELC